MSCQILSALEVSLFSSQLAGLSRPLNGSISAVEHAGGRKRGKVAELLRTVKNLFLQIDRFAGLRTILRFAFGFCDRRSLAGFFGAGRVPRRVCFLE